LDSYLASLGDTSHPACDLAYPQRQSVRFQWPEGSYGAAANK